MANTYTLITSNTLSVATTTVTFSSIPSTFKDLVLRTSIRATGGSPSGILYLNEDTGSNYGVTYFSFSSGIPGSGQQTNASYFLAAGLGNTSDWTTYSNSEIYIPNYANTSYNKPIYVTGNPEANASNPVFAVYQTAQYWRSTAAISSISIRLNGTDMAAKSSFYLYGIKNS